MKRVELIDNIGTNSISNDWGFIDPSGVFQGKNARFVKAWWYTAAGQRCFEQLENRAVALPSGIYFVGLWIEENGVQRQVLVKVSLGN